MRTSRLLLVGALSAALIAPVPAIAHGPANASFSATVNVKRTYTNARAVDLALGKANLPAGTSVNAYLVSESGTPDPLKGDGRWRTMPTSITLGDADGEHTVHAWARATGGVVSARGSDTVFLDRVKPVATDIVTIPAQAVAPADPQDDRPTISSRSVALSFGYHDPGEDADPATGSGVARYAVVNGTTAPTSGSTAWTNAPSATGPVSVGAWRVTSGNGDKTVSLFVRDRAGNVSLVSSVYFRLQLAGPTVTLTIKDSVKTNKPAVTVKGTTGGPTKVAAFFLKVTGTSTAPDAPTAGANGWKIKPTLVTLPGPGTWYVWAWAKDDNGSVSAVPAMEQVMYDATAPGVDLEFDEPESDGVDTTVDRHAHWNATLDAGAGSPITHWVLKHGTAVPSAAEWKSIATALADPWTLTPGSGTKTVTLWAKDAAGNVGSDADTIVVTLPAPTMTLDLPALSRSLAVTGIKRTAQDNAGAGIAGYYLSETNSAPAAGASGWKIAPTSFTFSAGEGPRTLYAWVKDANGTVSASAASDTVVIDTIRPTALLSFSEGVFTAGGSDGTGTGITHYALLRTASGTVPAAPISTSAAWKATSAAAVGSVTLLAGANQVTLFTRDAAGNVSVVDQSEPGVSTLVVTVP